MLAIFDQSNHLACPQQFNLSAHVLQFAHKMGDKTALSIVDESRRRNFSFAELERRVRGAGTGLLATGARPGEFVLLRLGNTEDFPIAFLGAIAVGLVPIATSSQLTELETAAIIDALDPAVILHDPNVACPDDPAIVPDTLFRTMWDLPPCAYQLADPDRVAYVVYTSGTSGTPRPVAHAHRAIWARQMMIRWWYDLGETDRVMHAGAFNWTFTLGTGLMDPWSVGATAVIPGAQVSTADLPRIAAQEDITIFAAVPGIYRKILKSNTSLVLPKLRHSLSAGEKLSATIRSQWETATNTRLFEAFGMSECSTFISHGPQVDAAPNSLGQPQPGRRVAILGDDGPVSIDEPGVIAIHKDDPGLMVKYIDAPEATRQRFQGEWFVTGDHGRMDAQGNIFYLGRHDDMMNAGGFRVSPIEVESALSHCPGVTQIAVTVVSPKPDVEIIVGFFTGSPELDSQTLFDFAQTCLAGYKQPRAFVRLDTMPTNANGKLNRRALGPNFKG